MALENGTYVNSLVPANPASTDGLAQADDHIRLIKSTLKNTFPNLTGPVTATQATLNSTPSSLTDLGITDGTASGQVLTTDGSGNFSFTALPAAVSSVPSGIISLWSGASNAIPAGYALCDGNNNTPDLRNRFVIGAGSAYGVGATGGSADATLVAHTHTFSGSTSTKSLTGTFDTSKPNAATGIVSVSSEGIGPAGDGSQYSGARYTIDASHSHTLSGSTGSTGSSATNANLPPYYALCYIMKT